MGLTSRQRKFCDEYMIDLNFAQAAIRAGYSETYAKHNSADLLSNTVVAKRIQKLKAGLAKKAGVKAENVIAELVKVGFSNIRDYMTIDEEGDMFLRAFDGIAPEKLAAIESINLNTTKNKDESREYTTTKFKLHSKLAALNQLCRHLGLFEKDNIQRGGLSIIIEAPGEIEEAHPVESKEIIIKGLVVDDGNGSKNTENKT